jgi:hypothetical protein
MWRICLVPALLTVTGLSLMTACSSSPLPLRTRYIGEAVHVSTAGQTGQDTQIKQDLPRPPEKIMKSCGISPIAAADVVLVRYYYYWNNVMSGKVRSHETWAAVAPGLSVLNGNVVEVEIRSGAEGPNSRCPTVAAILYPDLASGGCKYRDNSKATAGSVVDIFNPFGGPGQASLNCPGLDKEGWLRPKPTATGMSVWVKPAPEDPAGDSCGYSTP